MALVLGTRYRWFESTHPDKEKEVDMSNLYDIELVMDKLHDIIGELNQLELWHASHYDAEVEAKIINAKDRLIRLSNQLNVFAQNYG